MKTPQILVDAQNNWSEDEAALTADAFASRRENGYTLAENQERFAKDVAHMRKVFSFEADAEQLTTRYINRLRTLHGLIP